MRATTRPAMRHTRVPLTITLKPSTYDFVEACAARREFRSVDELFEAALAIYKNHLDAVNAFVELQTARGFSRDEIMRMAEAEIVFTKRRVRKGDEEE